MRIKTDHIEYNFKDFNGNTWCDSWVDSYNHFNDILKKFQSIPDSELSPLTKKEINFYLDQRHKIFTLHVELAEARNSK